VWCFDRHDDLLYNIKGHRRVRGKIAQRILVCDADILVHSAPTLAELFPTSKHLGNASSTEWCKRTPQIDCERVLILASFDERFDFEFLRSVARQNPNLQFCLHGRISQNDASIKSIVNTLVREEKNIAYAGAYTNHDLPELLRQYAITLAPY